MIPHDTQLQIGSLLFEGIDQIDLTGPFEVLSRIPNTTYRFTGGVTAGIDGALPPSCAAMRSHKRSSFTWPTRRNRPSTAVRLDAAPSPILEQARRSVRTITVQREQPARRVAAKLGIAVAAAGGE